MPKQEKQQRCFVKKTNRLSAFTIVELIVVILVIGILTAMVAVSYNASLTDSREESMKSDLTATYSKLSAHKKAHGEYPQALGNNAIVSDGTTFTYNVNSISTGFCLTAARRDVGSTHYIDNDGAVKDGTCILTPVVMLQTVTTSNCPAARTLATDARDYHTYWIQKLADGKCWMLTNLSYTGDGTNTYNDVIPNGDGTNGTIHNSTSDNSMSYTSAKYYVHAKANYTISPSQASTSTDGGLTNLQYGYYYNWCAAMGAQATTSACANATTPLPDTSKSICPAGWRLPTSGSGGEYQALNTAINGGSLTSDSGLRAIWLIQYGGVWSNGSGGFIYQDSYGYYWSSSQALAYRAYDIGINASYIDFTNSMNKTDGQSVRCVASS